MPSQVDKRCGGLKMPAKSSACGLGVNRSLRPRCRFPLTFAALAEIALDAVAAIESGRAPATDWNGRAKELLDRQAAAERSEERRVGKECRSRWSPDR